MQVQTEPEIEHCNARFPIAFPLLVHCNPDAHIYKEEHFCQGTSASAWSKSYNPIWAMLHKLRNAMGKRDSQYELCGTIELDEGFFSTEVPEEEKDKPLKRGRGSQKKTTVLVMAETASGKDDNPKNGKKPTAVKHIKMLVVDSLKAVDIDPKVKENINRSLPLYLTVPLHIQTSNHL